MSTARASRALVAYFDHKLASRLTRYVLKTASPAAGKAIADAVFAMIPKACEKTVWGLVLKLAEETGARIVASDRFKKKVDATAEENAETWIEEAVERTVAERVRRAVESAAKNDYASAQAVKAAPGKFQGLLDAELARLAREKAREVSGS